MSWKLTHPDSDLTIERESEQVDMYLAAGWQTVSGRKPDAPAEQ